MSINVTCPHCHTVAEVPDSAAGARGKCRACGEAVRVPARNSAKHCVVCGADVARLPRTKDAQGNYYCQSCYDAQTADSDPNTTDEVSLDALAAAVAQSSRASGGAKQTDNNWFTCPICHSQVTLARMDGSGVCIDCARGSASRRGHAKRTQPNTSGVRKVVFRASVVVIALFIALASFVALRIYLREQAFQEQMRASDEEYARDVRDSAQRRAIERTKAQTDTENLKRLQARAQVRSFADLRYLSDRAQTAAADALAKGDVEAASQQNEKARLLLKGQMKMVPDLEQLGDARFDEAKQSLLADESVPEHTKIGLANLRLHDSAAFAAISQVAAGPVKQNTATPPAQQRPPNPNENPFDPQVTGTVASLARAIDAYYGTADKFEETNTKFEAAAAKGDLATAERLQAHCKAISERHDTWKRQIDDDLERLQRLDRGQVLAVLDNIVRLNPDMPERTQNLLRSVRSDLTPKGAAERPRPENVQPRVAVCPRCGGTGRKSQQEIDAERSAAMSQVMGTGGFARITVDPDCPQCGGSGRIEIQR